MVVVGENLQELMVQHGMVDRSHCYNVTCIQLSLGSQCIRLKPNTAHDTLTYGEPIPPDCIEKVVLDDSGLVLPSKTAALAASAEKIYLPMGYMGLLQTKGSLARLCVSLHCSDGQIDPGFKGNVTFEIFNASDFTICIRKLQPVGNLYIFTTSTSRHPPYEGKYANADGPTIQLPFN